MENIIDRESHIKLIAQLLKHGGSCFLLHCADCQFKDSRLCYSGEARRNYVRIMIERMKITKEELLDYLL